VYTLLSILQAYRFIYRKKAAETPEGHFAHHNHKQVRHGNVKIATAIADVFIVSLAGDQYRVCGLCCTPLP